MKDYVVLQKGDVNVAVTGVFGVDALACAPTCELLFRDPVEAVRETVAEIKANEDVDMIVCVSHSGTWEDESKSEDEILAKSVPDLDLIISGHTHTELAEPIVHGVKVSDAIMVARGDMGVEIPMEEIPIIQKRLIAKCYGAGKPVITATQMLESMTKNPRPTRAEITDVANAIYDGTSAIMLSGETAAGKYPVESVRTMALIAMRTESDINYIERFRQNQLSGFSNVTTAISHAACTTAHDLGANAIITVTKSGNTARMISRFRPVTQIIGCSPCEKVCRQLALSWGVAPMSIEEQTTSDDLFKHAISLAVKNGFVEYGDLAVITAGLPLGVSGTTNILKVQIVGDVLSSGTGISSGNDIVCGNLCVCRDEDEARQNFRDGEILVIPSTSNRIVDLLRHARGLICEMDGEDSHAAIVGQALGIPVIVGALGATKILKSGTAVTVDAKRGMVYCGEKVSKETPI